MSLHFTSPVVLGVTVDGLCKHAHGLAVLALLEHLNSLLWILYTHKFKLHLKFNLTLKAEQILLLRII